jgi:hypothetical protein
MKVAWVLGLEKQEILRNPEFHSSAMVSRATQQANQIWARMSANDIRQDSKSSINIPMILQGSFSACRADCRNVLEYVEASFLTHIFDG